MNLKWPIPKSSLISPLKVLHLSDLFSNYSLTKPPFALKMYYSDLKFFTSSELYVLEKKELENKENPFISKDLLSIELLNNSWLKEEISPLVTEVEENLFMEWNSKMKTLLLNMKFQDFYLWQMLDPTLTEVNSSSPSFLALG